MSVISCNVQCLAIATVIAINIFDSILANAINILDFILADAFGVS